MSIVSGLLGGSQTEGQRSGRVAQFKLSGNPYFQAQVDATRGMDHLQLGAKGKLRNLQGQGIKNALWFGNQARHNPQADMARQMGMDFLGGVQAYDPYQIAQQQFGLLNPILQEQHQQDFLGLEGRQFAQGRLGSTGGGLDMNALFDAQRDAERKLLFDSLGLGMQAQEQQVGLGSQLLQLDPQLRGMFSGIGNQQLGGALNIQQSAADTFRALAGAQGGAGTGSSGGDPFGSALVSGALAGMTGGISTGVEGLFKTT